MNAEQIYSKLLSAGLTSAGACGLMGNMKAESKMASNNAQNHMTSLSDERYTELVDDSADGGYVDPNKGPRNFFTDAIGYGLFQLTYSGYKREFFYYARKLGVSISDAAAQIDYVLGVIKSEFPSLWNSLKTSGDVDACARLVCVQFERPKVLNIAERQKYAKEFFNSFASVKTGSDKLSNSNSVINIAKDEIGYLEKASNAYLDDKTANAGSANWTKYARDLWEWRLFNGNKNGYPWCTSFVVWCFVKAYGKAAAIEMTCQPANNSLAADCAYAANYYKQQGRFSKTPQVGDQIFFSYNGTVGHTGLVVAVNGGTVTTIEGNTSGASGVIPNGGGVCQKTYLVNSSSIYGFGHPKYDGAPAALMNTASRPTGSKPTHMYTIQVPLLKKGQARNNGCLNLQAILNANGYDCGTPTGIFDAKTEAQVKDIQKDLGLLADGEVGIDTWKKLFAL